MSISNNFEFPAGPLKILGLMSGTSMDGLDCLLCTINLSSNYNFEYKVHDFKTMPYSNKTKQQIVKALAGDVIDIQLADTELGNIFGTLAHQFLNGRSVDLIGSHGQTVAHEDKVSTLQIGNPAPLSQMLNAPVVYDVRQADIAAGGNGAPLVPFLDWLLFRNQNQDIVTLNLGGVANLTYVPASGERDQVVGFDTGPGMGLIDECCMQFFDDSADWNGKYSRQGQINQQLLISLMNHEFLSKVPPKSTGRHEFGKDFLAHILDRFEQVSPSDLLRTLIVFTAKSVTENIIKFLNFTGYTGTLFLSGGGAHHPQLKKDLSQFLPSCRVENIQETGLDPDAKEALLMAVLAMSHIRKLPANMISVTGASNYAILGKLTYDCS